MEKEKLIENFVEKFDRDDDGYYLKDNSTGDGVDLSTILRMFCVEYATEVKREMFTKWEVKTLCDNVLAKSLFIDKNGFVQQGRKYTRLIKKLTELTNLSEEKGK